MIPEKQIRFLKRPQIDPKKWDGCIRNAPNGVPYALTLFLDIMAPGWNALVVGDYEMVMPLPTRKKWGITYIFQPFLTPFLGVFCEAESNVITNPFLDHIPQQFKLWDLSLNPTNAVQSLKGFVIPRTNYLLPLDAAYASIKAGYHPHLKRSLQKAGQAALLFKQDIPVQEIIAICKTQYPHFTKVAAGDFEKVERLCYNLKNDMITYGVFSPDGNLLASCVFMRFGRRLYYWLPGNKPEGRNVGASAFLLDRVIAANAATDRILDFEGSDDPGVALFYQRFGAVAEQYQTLYVNKLPFPLSLIKKMPEHYRQLLNNKAK